MPLTTIDPPTRPARRDELSPAIHPVVVYPFDAQRVDHWRRYFEAHPQATLFHGLGWKQAVERAFGHRFVGLMAYRGSRVVGVLPLYEIRSVIAGRLLVSVPYATYGGILADDAEAAAALHEEAVAECERIGARSIDYRSIRAVVAGAPVRSTHATFIRELPDSIGGVDVMLPRKARAAARNAASKHSLSCDFDPSGLTTMWNLYARSMRRIASPNYPPRFFRELTTALPDEHVVQIVRLDGRPVAGLLSFIYRDTLMPYFVGIDERVDVYGLSHYVYVESMKWGVARGLRVFDFGRSRIDNRGPYEFKRLCGFQPMSLEYQMHVPTGRAAPDLSPTSARWSVARRIWKRLPLAVTRPLGGWVAHSIPG